MNSTFTPEGNLPEDNLLKITQEQIDVIAAKSAEVIQNFSNSIAGLSPSLPSGNVDSQYEDEALDDLENIAHLRNNQTELAALMTEAESVKVVAKQYFAVLKFKTPPLQYSSKAEHVFDNTLISDLSATGAKYGFSLRFSDGLDDYNNWMKGQRQEIYRVFGMESIEGNHVFTAINPKPVYKAVAAWRKEADEKLNELAKSYDDMVADFKDRLVSALSDNMSVHRSREKLDDITTLSEEIADEFCAKRFTGIGDWKRGCGVQTPKIGLYFDEIIPDDHDEEDPSLSDDPEKRIAESEYLQSQVAMTLDGLREYSPLVCEQYFNLEVEASVLYSDNYKQLADDGKLCFMPILDGVRTELFNYHELTSDEVDNELNTNAIVSDEALIAVRGVAKSVVERIAVELSTLKGKRVYKTAHYNIKENCESVTLKLDSLIDRWAKLLDAGGDQIRSEIISDNQIMAWVSMFPLMKKNIGAFHDSATDEIASIEAEAAKPKAPRGRPKKHKTEDLFASDDDLLEDDQVEEPTEDQPEEINEVPVVEQSLEAKKSEPKTKKLGAKGTSTKAKKLGAKSTGVSSKKLVPKKKPD